MRISVIGCGYLGAVHAACMADAGHEVVGIDRDEEKVRMLSAGRAPFFEPGLPELLAHPPGRLRFSTDIADAASASVHFITVGTPQVAGGTAADVSFVDAAVDGLLPHLSAGDVVVGKSTVPVGTAGRLAARIESAGARLVWNPEFLREGRAVSDTVAPDRVVYGVAEGDETSVGVLDAVYARSLERGIPRIVTDHATAELVKIAANSFLATKISFINAMAEIAEATGADVTTLADAIGHDARIGRRFLNAGIGFGGGCMPKDIRAFQARAAELGLASSLAFLDEVDQINLRRRQRAVDLVREELGPLERRRIAVLGLAFKPDSDDVRDSPALEIACRLRALGATVTATDPEAITTARRSAPEIEYAVGVRAAVHGADAIVVATEWPQFRALVPAEVARWTAARVIIDGRNCLDAEAWRAAGFRYRGLGRS
ncbi:UDP-glucose/GDP-mannose dehydrogenase family protein [Microcella daejeonensis]|uniref:UDP-glucose 6-dehydrogenase n=1 Tax=Microcella daejeonensis TaxID=2994971 RepID=A0A9E8S8R5_9MICO|nr:UDP-glucose/GDP-mannose dehydrogenase family protein [Microcella daejeonensis]WAB81890.1 UDP-glucose/GDP-mannose dehydrogenase family protein [Microcella daejeonensis]